MMRKKNSRSKTNMRDRDERRSNRNIREDRPGKESSRNDISWYSRFPNLLVAAGSFPYPYRPGMQMTLGTPYSTKPSSATEIPNRNYFIPGVMVMDWVPTIGISNTATDPASVLGKEMYSRVRSKYSGALVADAPDFVMYVLAMDSIYAYTAWLKRLYRTLSAWSPENFVTPDQLLQAMGLTVNNIKTLRAEKTQLWQLINELILQSRKFMVPAALDIFNRHFWMSDNVYLDDNNIQGQFYLFNPKALYKFQEQPVDTEGNLASGLTMTPMPFVQTASNNQVVLHAQDLYQYGRDMIDALVAWDEALDISGYLMRAYEGVPSFVVSELQDSELLVPVYEPEVLSQIENSRCVPAANYIGDWSGFNIKQSVVTNAVISNPTYTINQSMDDDNEISALGYNIPPMLSIRSQTPTVADSVIASRLQSIVISVENIAAKGSTPAQYKVFVTAGTEISINWRIVNDSSYFTMFPRLAGVPIPSQPGYPWTTTGITVSNHFGSILDIAQFDWHPIVLLTMYDTTYGRTKFTFVGDVHNVTNITVDAMRNLHKVCIYSELNAFSL